MLDYIWPIALVVTSNVVYQVCAKSVPAHMDPFASLTVTYVISALASAVMFFLMGGGEGLLREYGKLNWGPSRSASSWSASRWAGSSRIAQAGR